LVIGTCRTATKRDDEACEVADLFQLLFEPTHRVLMTRIYGKYVLDDIVLRDRAVARFVARNGLARGLMDFTAVESVDVPIDRLVRRAHEPPVLPGQFRVIVAPDPLTYELNRVVIAHQLYSRKVEPLLVRSLAEAHQALSLVDPKFQPVESNEADQLDDSMTIVLARMDEMLDVTSLAAKDERRRLRQKLLRLLDTVPTTDSGQRQKSRSTITLSDVFNAALNRSAVTDNDLVAVCSQCRRKTTLGLCKVVSGRETTYSCPRCESVLTTLTPTGASDPVSPANAYRLGAFLVRTAVDLECPGARLPRTY
jgi:ElaB/YqjD/DUF883 family membrane-anchored ribosome-binding protein